MRVARKDDSCAQDADKGGGCRNFQQLLRLKLMRQQRRSIMPLGNLKSGLPCPVGRWQLRQRSKEVSEEKEAGEERESGKQRGKLAYIVRRHSKVDSSGSSKHIRDGLRQVKTDENKTITPRYKALLDDVRYQARGAEHMSASNLQLIQPVHVLHHNKLQHVRSIQEHFVRAREQLIGKAARPKRSTASLQSKGSSIVPLSAALAMGTFNKVLSFRVMDKDGKPGEERERLKTYSRYNQIPISEFLYENGRKQEPVNSGLQAKLELICRRDEARVSFGDGDNNLQVQNGVVGGVETPAAFG